MEKLIKIIEVNIVPGNELNDNWKISMQAIFTDKDFYIDRTPKDGGHDWKREIGKKVYVYIKESKGYQWISPSKKFVVFKKQEIIHPKQEIITTETLPADYDINNNPELKETYEAIKQGVQVIFLTGGAGTGKTTFIKYLKNNLKTDLNKNYIVLAPTGVAAINAGGQTIHSFFKFKFDPFENKDIDKLVKNQVVAHVDLIIIDEVSMVPSWMIDHIDYALRLWCSNKRPFGGKQILLIGDCFQLPPVVDKNDEDAMNFYKQWESPFFFAAKVFKEAIIKGIQLKVIYRQQEDQDFINKLNRIRTMEKRYEEDISFINDNCFQDDEVPIPVDYLLLTTKNERADECNKEKLLDLINKGKAYKIYKAKIEGTFPNDYRPSPEKLEVCLDAKVMVTKNINSLGLVNGDRGRVTGLDDNKVIVRINKNNHWIKYTLQKESWQIFKYIWDENSKTIQQEVVATFSQIPLKLGWAVTIHKSQGLTLDKAAIDADDAWDYGQVYVALSRIKKLEGIFLVKKIPISAVKIDPYVKTKYIELFPEQFKTEFVLHNKMIPGKQVRKGISVLIGKEVFNLYPKNPEKRGAIQEHVKETMSLLLAKKLIPRQELERLLNDKDYCYKTFDIHFIKNNKVHYALLSKDKEYFYDPIYNMYRCWEENISGYYICSQWYKHCSLNFAEWLKRLSRGELS